MAEEQKQQDAPEELGRQASAGTCRKVLICMNRRNTRIHLLKSGSALSVERAESENRW